MIYGRTRARDRSRGHGALQTGSIWAADFSAQSAGAGSVASFGLTFARASSGHSVQSGDTSVVLVSGNDSPRYGRRASADPMGLVVEPERTTLIVNSRQVTGSGWTPGLTAATADYAAGLDGTTVADRVQANSGGYGPYAVITLATATKYIASAWLRGTTAGGIFQLRFSATGGTTVIAAASGTDSVPVYRRVEVRLDTGNSTGGQLHTSDGADRAVDGGIAAGARDAVIDLIQVELGRYATEAMVTTGTGATRAGERLYHPTGSALLVSGRLSLAFTVQPKGSSLDYAGSNPRLWTVDANNYCEIDATTRLARVVVGGAAYVAPVPLTWAANDVVDVFVRAGNGVPYAAYRVNGGASTLLSTDSPSSQGSLSIPGALDLLCNGTAQQFGAWTRKIEAYS